MDEQAETPKPAAEVETTESISEDDGGDTTLGSLHFDALSPTDFEEFSFDLMSESGFSNVDGGRERLSLPRPPTEAGT